MQNLFIFLHLSECNQPQAQDDQCDVSIVIHNNSNNLLTQDVSHISYHKHDSTDTPPSGNSDGFDPGDLDEYEQQDTVLQAEWQAHVVVIRALSQLGINQSSATGSGSEEANDSSTAISRIEIIKIT